MSVAVIINPASGRATSEDVRRRVELASASLSAHGEQGEVFVSRARGHARELSTAALAAGARIVIAWGGDGTVNEVASPLVGTSTALGIVPAGSGNGLARELGIDRDPARALERAFGNALRTIDAGELGGRLFFNVAGVGFDARVAECFDREGGGRRGLATYIRITVRELLRYQPALYRIDPGDGPRRALLVTFANGRQFGNSALIAPTARPDDGFLDLVAFEERSRLSTLQGLPRLFTGGITRVEGVSITPIRHASVEADRPMGFHVDGEPLQGGSRLEARVVPSCLRVVIG